MITKKNLIENLHVNELLDKIKAKFPNKEHFRFLYTDNLDEVNNITSPIKIVPVVIGEKALPIENKSVEFKNKYYFLNINTVEAVKDWAIKNNYLVEILERDFSIGIAVLYQDQDIDFKPARFLKINGWTYILDEKSKDKKEPEKVIIPEIREEKDISSLLDKKNQVKRKK